MTYKQVFSHFSPRLDNKATVLSGVGKSLRALLTAWGSLEVRQTSRIPCCHQLTKGAWVRAFTLSPYKPTALCKACRTMAVAIYPGSSKHAEDNFWAVKR